MFSQVDIQGPDPGAWVDALIEFLQAVPGWGQAVLYVLLGLLIWRGAVIPTIKVFRK